MTKDSVRIAGIQMKLVSESTKAKERNFKKAMQMMEEAESRNAEVICLPELFLGAATVEDESSHTVNLIKDFAKEYHVYIIPNLYQIKNGSKFSSSPIIDPSGEIVGTYHKTHLFPWEYKFSNITPGEDLPIFELDKCKIGVLICQDAMVPEAPRILTIKGAEVIFIQSRMPGPFLVPWRETMRVRAIENQVFIVSVGGAGYDSCGSLVVAPRLVNDIVVEAGKDEQILFADINLSWLRECRKRENQPLYFAKSVDDMRKGLRITESYTFPLDRNPNLYRELLDTYDPTKF